VFLPKKGQKNLVEKGKKAIFAPLLSLNISIRRDVREPRL
jgi:hypothetical protein